MFQPATAAVRSLSGVKEPVLVATTEGIAFAGLQTIDGVILKPGDRVLVKDQFEASENGIYTASPGRWHRAPDAANGRFMDRGISVRTQAGTVNGGREWIFTQLDARVGTDPITVSLYFSDDFAGEIAGKLDKVEFDQFEQETDEALALKADIVGGKVPSTQLPAPDLKPPVIFAKADPMQPTRLFAAPTATPDMQSDKLLRAATPFNSTAGNYTANGIEIAAEGSAFNGPRTASLGLTVSAYKEGFGTGSAKAGEIDNIYLVLRQDGPRVNDQDTFGANRSDGCGILIDAAVYPGVGFVGGIEGNTSLLPTSGTGTTKAMAYQIGCMDTTTNSKATGFFTSAAKGDHAAGLFVYNAEANGGYFDNLIYCGNDQGQLFGVSRRGEVSLGRHTPGGATISNAMHLVVQTNASLGVLNANKSVQLLNLTQSGDLSAFGSVNGVAINGSVSVQAPLISATAMVRIAPSGSMDNSANWIAGTLGVGPSGRLRYCDANGAQPKFVQLSTT